MRHTSYLNGVYHSERIIASWSLRSFIPTSVPWLACSVTLDPCTLAKVIEFSGFGPKVYIQRSSVNRPDVFISLKQMAHSATSFEDLIFLIHPAGQALKKAVIEASPSQVRATIAMGINNLDIKEVVQWKLPSTLYAVWQRAGRAARRAGIESHFTELVEPPKPSKPSNVSRELFNLVSNKSCIRKVILSFFSEDVSYHSHPNGVMGCCSFCRGVAPAVMCLCAKKRQPSAVTEARLRSTSLKQLPLHF